MDPVSAFASLTTAINVVKELKGYEKKVDAAQFKLQLAELMEALADAKMSTVSLQDELREKDAAIIKLKESFERKSKTVLYDGFRYELDEDENPFGYPFCNRCMTVDGLMIKVEQVALGVGILTLCPQCKAKYNAYKAETIPQEFEKLSGQAVKP